MTLGEIGEDALVARLTRGLPLGSEVVAGPGDDCAVVRVAGAERLQLLKTDCVIEGVHFRRDQPAARVGWKALARAVSDLAACGGLPAEALVTVAAPSDLAVRYLEGIYAGIGRAARAFGVSVVGGETARSPGGIFLSVALTGWVEPERLVLRSGGRVGDGLYVTGRLGGSFGADGAGRHLRFTPRLAEARWLTERGGVRAMMDLSDGLGSDLPRLAAASGAGFRMDRGRIPRQRGCSVEQAISDGEDYELLFAVDPGRAEGLDAEWAVAFPKVRLTRIGELVAVGAGERIAAGFGHFGTD